MFIKRFELFKMFGFPIRIDLSWFIIVILLTWSLAAMWFPSRIEDLSAEAYWTMGLAGALGLFVSVLLHELAHAIAARQYGIRMNGITLFIFGGVAEMQDEPPSAVAEFVVAIAGPIASVLIAAACTGFSILGRALDVPMPIVAVSDYLAIINTILVIFNMIPAFPLDGGRVLRSAIWYVTNNLRRSTYITSAIGSGFGMALIVFGVLQLFMFGAAALISAMWMALIGLFLRNAAQMSYQQLLVRRALEGEPIARFMKSDLVTVPPDITVEAFINDYIYRYYHKMYPVIDDDGRPIGCITTQMVKPMSAEERATTTVGDAAAPCSEENTVSIHRDAMQALAKMRNCGSSRLMVMDGDDLVGIITLKDLLEFLSLKVELDDDGSGRMRI